MADNNAKSATPSGKPQKVDLPQHKRLAQGKPVPQGGHGPKTPA